MVMMMLIYAWRLLCLSMYETVTNVFEWRRRVTSNKCLNGRVVFITGANTGIGKETVHQLTLREARINVGKGMTAVSEIQALNPKADIKLVKLDLSSLTSVRKCAEELSRLETKADILINNAGVMACPEWQTADGHEMQLGTNHLGHFLLTIHLLPLLNQSESARIVSVSSSLNIIGAIHTDNINLRNGAYGPIMAYGQSKLAQVLFTRELAKRLTGTNITAYCLNPGSVRTDLQRYTPLSAHTFIGRFIRYAFLIAPHTGAQTTLYCAIDDTVANESGFYYEYMPNIENLMMLNLMFVSGCVTAVGVRGVIGADMTRVKHGCYFKAPYPEAAPEVIHTTDGRAPGQWWAGGGCAHSQYRFGQRYAQRVDIAAVELDGIGVKQLGCHILIAIALFNPYKHLVHN
ncbi:unnamed protein product, partial [Medioppia subpectinata]